MQSLGGKLFAALASSSVDNQSALGSFHSFAESTCFLTFDFTWLKGAFHVSIPEF